MAKLKVIIEIEVNCDSNDDESIRDAIYEILTSKMEAEDLEFQIEEEDEDETYE